MEPKQSFWSSLVDLAYFVVIGVLGFKGSLTEHSLLTLLWIFAAGRFGTGMYKHALRMAGTVPVSGSGGGTGTGTTIPPPSGSPVSQRPLALARSKPEVSARQTFLRLWFQCIAFFTNNKVQTAFFAVAMVVLSGCILATSK